jgi:hypothetical protein
MKSQIPTKSLIGDLLFLIENKISYWNSTLILHNHHPQPPATTELPISHLHTSMCSVYNISLKYE